jgi:hypothetical protein
VDPDLTDITHVIIDEVGLGSHLGHTLTPEPVPCT